ncbi:MAG: hypothetical protein QOJ07_3016 [Thermoleophilaceae bacterium]|nr:hypothetical protein [Thermoleophilaceae bacterium]
MSVNGRPVPVVLAAGLGSRLGGRPKALFELDGRTLLDRCAERLAEAGFESMVVMTGHGAGDVESYWASEPRAVAATFVHNPRYAELNNFYTLEVACRECAPGALMALNSDIVLAPGVIERATQAAADLVLVVEPGQIDDEALGVRVEGERPLELGKHLDTNEFIGVSILSPRGRDAYVAESERALAAERTNLYYEDVFSAICGSVDATIVPTPPATWAEIDVPEDLPGARAVIG